MNLCDGAGTTADKALSLHKVKGAMEVGGWVWMLGRAEGMVR